MNGSTTEKKKKLFFIEGNISSSKTTVLKACEKAGYTVFDEPLDIWTAKYVEKNGDNILKLFYENMERWSFQTEVAIMTTRFKRLVEALAHNSDVVVLERSLFTDFHVFAPNLYDNNNMTDMEWIIYEDWYNTFMSVIKPMMIDVHDVTFLYINTSPEECLKRKTSRARLEENEMVPEYLIHLHKKHNDWLLDKEMKYQVYNINGNGTQNEVAGAVINAIRSSIGSIVDANKYQSNIHCLSKSEQDSVWQQMISDGSLNQFYGNNTIKLHKKSTENDAIYHSLFYCNPFDSNIKHVYRSTAFNMPEFIVRLLNVNTE